MIVEIHGAGFRNKGAELMLHTTVSELRARLENFVPAIDPLYGAYELRCGLGLRQIIPPRSHVGTPGFSKRFRRQKWFVALRGPGLFRRLLGAQIDLYGAVDLSRVRGFIDISGFAYTDQWGPQPIQDLATLTHYYRWRRRPVIMLPQAFGPFKRPECRAAFLKALSCADLVFARDKRSWEYAADLAREPEKIFQAPDITLFYPRSQVQRSLPPTPYACLVPNVRMLDQGKDQWGDKYLTYLCLIARELLNQGIQVQILVHDVTGGDLSLAEDISRELTSPDLTIVREQDPLVLKNIIGQSLLLAGSRYHSLVAAFANAVPAIGLGWAHKYEMLFQDFDCKHFAIGPDRTIKAVLENVRELADSLSNEAYRKRIASRLEEMFQINQDMWQRVADLLTSTAG